MCSYSTYIHTFLYFVEGKLKLSENVDTSVLAIKYELTGGFIKNAGMYVRMYVCVNIMNVLYIYIKCMYACMSVEYMLD